MSSTSDLKGLRDIKTAISTHSRSASRHKATPYLEISSFGLEKLRLETELARLAKRQGRIEPRLGEIRQLLGERVTRIQEEQPETDPAGKAGVDERATEARRSVPPNLRTMKVEY